MDTTDRELLGILSADGRATFAELAERVSLSGVATADRVRRLEASGAIAGYEARLDPAHVDADLASFVAVTLDGPHARDAFVAAMSGEPSVLELHHVAGDDDYLLKVRCRDTRDLERVVSERIKGIPGVARTRTTVVLSSVFERALGMAGR